MKNKLLIVLVFPFVISSCFEQDEIRLRRNENGVITSMPYLWKTSLSTNGTLIDGLIEHDVSYNGNVHLPNQDGETIKMAMLSATTGEILWEWNDLFEIDEDYFITSHYRYGKYLAFQQGFRFYTIDLSNGITVQKEKRKYSGSITGIDGQYFIAGNYTLNDDGHYTGNV